MAVPGRLANAARQSLRKEQIPCVFRCPPVDRATAGGWIGVGHRSGRSPAVLPVESLVPGLSQIEHHDLASRLAFLTQAGG